MIKDNILTWTALSVLSQKASFVYLLCQRVAL